MTIKERIKRIKLKTTQVYIALISKETPWLAKIVAGLTIGYALSPIDLIPDFIPIFGYLDDLIILPVLIYICIHLIPKSTWESYEPRSQKIWENGVPTKWYFAIPIIMTWLLLITWIFVKWILA
ncbi:MAG: YkvA family protein [Tenericutes bacterium]|jgi:uncharacterized membrane protein YkvA (DUF1232 family)|nr:YkvA family protein [Mycoplasmatota bacterium]